MEESPSLHLDITTYMAIRVLEKVGFQEPTAEQVSFMEKALTKVSLKTDLIFDISLDSMECYLLMLMLKGQSLKEIAEIFKLEFYEIERLKLNLMEKLDCKVLEQCVFQGVVDGHFSDLKNLAKEQ